MEDPERFCLGSFNDGYLYCDGIRRVKGIQALSNDDGNSIVRVFAYMELELGCTVLCYATLYNTLLSPLF